MKSRILTIVLLVFLVLLMGIRLFILWSNSKVWVEQSTLINTDCETNYKNTDIKYDSEVLDNLKIDSYQVIEVNDSKLIILRIRNV